MSIPSSYNRNLRTYSNGFRVRIVDPEDGFYTDDHPFPITLGDSLSRDPFSRLKVSMPVTLLENVPGYGLNPLSMDTYTLGAGATATFSASSSFVQLNTGAVTSGNRVVRQTKAYAPYFPGKGQTILISFCPNKEDTTNVQKNVGYFDDNNGFFFRNNNNKLFLVWRTSTLTGAAFDNVIAQSDWNIDQFDGTGPSGVNLDLSKTQILYIDFQWLGVGRARIGFGVDGNLFLAHEFLFTNNYAVPYMRSGFLPVRYEIRNTGLANTACTMKEICLAVMTEKSNSRIEGLSFSVGTGKTTTSVSTRRNVLSIRQVQNLNGLPYFGDINLSNLGVYCADADVTYDIVLNPVFTGGIWTSVGANTGIEFNTFNTSVVGGTILKSGYISATNKISNVGNDELPDFKFGKTYLGTSDIISFVFESLSGSALIACSLGYKEWY